MDTIASRPDTKVTLPLWMMEWLSARNIHNDVVDMFNLSVRPSRRVPQGLDLVIPVYDAAGRFLFNKYRRDPRVRDSAAPKYEYDHGAKSALFGANHLGDTSLVILCEGELDALFLWSQGFTAVSSTGGAGTFDPEWASLLKGREVVICYDNDKAGTLGALRAQLLLPNARIAQVPHRGGVKDLTEYGQSLKESIPLAVDRLVTNAQRYNIAPVEGSIKTRKTTYLERVRLFRDLRANLSRFGNADLTFVDILIASQQQLLDDIAREQKMKKRARTGGIRDTRSVDAARAVPIPNYVKFNRQGMAKCLWHTEDSPSLHYIRTSNKVHCFGCNVTKDVIEVIMQLESCNWGEALNKLV